MFGTAQFNMTAPDQQELEHYWKEKAKLELNETEETMKNGLASLRCLIKDRKLKSFQSDDFLLRFLRARKYKIEMAYNLLENYMEVRKREKELFSVKDALADVDKFGDGWQCILQGRDNEGRAVLIFRPGMYNLVTDKSKGKKPGVTVDQSFRMNFLSLEWSLLDARTQIAGLTAVVDLTGFSLPRHALFLSPFHSMKTSSVVQDTVPVRIGGFHVINEPHYMDAIYALFRPFLKEKIRERVYFHGSHLEELHKYISPDVLPMELGGKCGTMVCNEWKTRLFSRAEQILAYDPTTL